MKLISIIIIIAFAAAKIRSLQTQLVYSSNKFNCELDSIKKVNSQLNEKVIFLSEKVAWQDSFFSNAIKGKFHYLPAIHSARNCFIGYTNFNIQFSKKKNK